MRTFAFALALAALAACGSTTPRTDSDKEIMAKDVEVAKLELQKTDPSIKKWFDTAQGYAIFPDIGKGGLIVGGAHGRGEVYEKGALIGWARMTQGTVGLQAGGQAYTEVIFFKDKTALDGFKQGNYEVSANASAVIATAGAGANAEYSHGVAIFVHVKGGLMAEASVGGQKFSFEPK